MSKPHDYAQHNIGDKFGNLELVKTKNKVWTLRCGCEEKNIVTVWRTQVVKADGRRSCGKCGYRKRSHNKESEQDYSYNALNLPGYYLSETRTVNGAQWHIFKAVML